MLSLSQTLKLLTQRSLDLSHLENEELEELQSFLKSHNFKDKIFISRKKSLLPAIKIEKDSRLVGISAREIELTNLDKKIRRLELKEEELRVKIKNLKEEKDSLDSKIQRMIELRNHIAEIYFLEKDK
jgi:predicted HTH domain antitoxin